VPEETRRAVEARYRLDDPLPVQYGNWLANLVRGDLGESYERRRPVREIIGDALPNSIRLAALAVAIELTIGAVAGILAAATKRPFLDVLVTVATLAAIGLPVYVLGSLLQWTLGFQLGWLPAAGTDGGFRSWILPACVLAIPSLAYAARLLRDGLRREMREPYTTVAATKGIGRRRVILTHALRNASIPVVTFLGLDFGVLIGGAIVVEALFDVHGMGFTIVDAVRQHDNPVIIGASLVLILVFLVVNLAVDLVVAALDPRVRRD
jgi:oligopeptide transport system permease protein